MKHKCYFEDKDLMRRLEEQDTCHKQARKAFHRWQKNAAADVTKYVLEGNDGEPLYYLAAKQAIFDLVKSVEYAMESVLGETKGV